MGVTDPFNDEPLRALAYLATAGEHPPVVPADFDKAYQASTRPRRRSRRRARERHGEASEIDVQRLRDMASEAPTIRLVNQIINEAVETMRWPVEGVPNTPAPG